METEGSYFDFVLPTKVKFGPGKRKELKSEVKSRGFKSIGIVTNEIIRDLGLLEGVEKNLQEDREVHVLTGVESNPHISTVSRGYNEFDGKNIDCLVGIGGGSVIDTTKAISLCLANGEEDIVQLDQTSERIEPSLPFFALPTTSGTGSEVDYWAVISKPETNEKLSIGCPEMAPLTAIVDPELTVTLPAELTFSTGIDAFSHALEAFLSAESNDLSDTLALKAMDLVFESLESAINNGRDLGARGDMSLASTLGGAAMQHVGLGLVHAMSHQISGFYDANHGLTNAKLLQPVLEFNREAVPDKLSVLEEKFDNRFTEKMENLLNLYDYSNFPLELKGNDLPELVERAVRNVNAETNPRPADRGEVRRIYETSFDIADE